jgi:molybdopterin converting factor small subunit
MSSTAIRVRLLAFGALKTIIPAGADWRDLTSGASVADLLALLCREGLTNAGALQSAAIAVNQQYSPRSCILQDGDEVAILPPVSGGLDAAASMGSRTRAISGVDGTAASRPPLTGGRIATSSPSWRMQLRGLYC